MSTHDVEQLGAYCLGALDTADAEAVARHLESCPDCRRELDELAEVRAQLARVPPESLLDGPADDSELLLLRTLRAAAEPRPATRSRRRWQRGPLLVAAAIVVLAGVFTGGLVTGRQGVPAPAAVAGARTFTATDAATGVGMTVDLTRSPGWVALQGRFTGVTPGTPCDIYLVTRAGERILAGGWVAPANANKVVVTVSGSAVVGSTQIVAIEIDTVAGRHLVTASV